MQHTTFLKLKEIHDDSCTMTLPPLLTDSTIISHMEYTMHAEVDESTPPLNGKKNPPWQDRLKHDITIILSDEKIKKK
jgi:uncharacterized protein YqiB (DUF1249 family)